MPHGPNVSALTQATDARDGMAGQARTGHYPLMALLTKDEYLATMGSPMMLLLLHPGDDYPCAARRICPDHPGTRLQRA